MGDNHYQQQLGLKDANGNLTNKAKVNRVYAVVRKYNISQAECERTLMYNNWDMDAAIDALRLSNDAFYQYANSHPNEIYQMLHHDSSMDESVAKFAVEHPHVVNAADKAPGAMSSCFGFLCACAFIMILAAFGI